MIERDDNIPPLAEFVEELDHARIAGDALGTEVLEHQGARRRSRLVAAE